MGPEAAVPRPILQMKGIVKTFPGVQALAGVDLDVWPGEVHALIGENGAGKSTLIRILGGVHHPDGGEIVLRGQPVVVPTPRRARELGIAIIHQELNQVGPLSVAENLFLADEPRRWRWFVDWAALTARARLLMADLGVPVDPRERVDLLSVAERQTVEIARALSLKADILVMDEPTAALTLEEVERLFAIIADLRARGVSVIYISHRLEEIFRIADRVTVLRDGRYIGTYPAGAIDLTGLIQRMVGRKLTEKFPKETVAPGAPRLEVRGLSVDGVFPCRGSKRRSASSKCSSSGLTRSRMRSRPSTTARWRRRSLSSRRSWASWRWRPPRRCSRGGKVAKFTPVPLRLVTKSQ